MHQWQVEDAKRFISSHFVPLVQAFPYKVTRQLIVTRPAVTEMQGVNNLHHCKSTVLNGDETAASTQLPDVHCMPPTQHMPQYMCVPTCRWRW